MGGMFGENEGQEGAFGFGGRGGGGMPFGGTGMGRGRPAPAQQLEVPLALTLEELFSGCTKKRKVTRHIVDAASGNSLPVEEVLEIPVRPGWKDGTRITFEGKGDERPGRPPQDLVFVVSACPNLA